MKTTIEKRNLIKEIAGSCDWSTNIDTCIECIKGDLKRPLEPIAKKLEETRSVRCIKVAQKLRYFFEKNRLARNIYRSAEKNITQAKQISQTKLETAFKLLIAILDGVKGNKIAESSSRKLKKLLLPPPLTKEEAAENRRWMINFGRISRKEMTLAERRDYDKRAYESGKERVQSMQHMTESVMKHRYGDNWRFSS